VNHEGQIVIEIYGDGKTELGGYSIPRNEGPDQGVIPILVHTLCNRNPGMRVRKYRWGFLQETDISRGTAKKVLMAIRRSAQRQLKGKSHGLVCVMDTEGEFPKKLNDMKKGRDLGPKSVPTAIGVAHPCIESWLLADAHAIQTGLSLKVIPAVPDKPEFISAPSKNRSKNPKTILRDVSGVKQNELSVEDKERIAKAMENMDLVKQRCERSFKPFAEEVETYIRPLFN
jgi:hypothetical protein